ncbi:glycosyltransferase family 2 protein [Paenibacillus elgii]|uniref:glycosyltransferase family 2 protein n=1 Tax=Paenibacillus elgii TaxID=189691 RepID=UPI0003139AE9|nr:glycosyltransferase [Paenibacillus elgii]
MMFISVVMAVYNGEKYIEEAIQSILNQTYPQFELIIINDGSMDRTREILDAIPDNRVKIVHAETNQGAAASLNLGIAHASGDWIAIHDADDISEPTRLEEQASYLLSHPESIGVGSLISGRIGNEVVINNSEVEYYNQMLEKEQIYKNRLFMCYLCHGSVMFSKKAFYDAGRYNPKYKISYDYDLWLRMFEISPIEKIPKVLYHYRLREDSLGKQNTDGTISELMTISSIHIYNKLIRKKRKQPALTVVGSKKGCLFFKKHVGKKFKKLNYVYVRTRKDYRKIRSLNKRGRIQAAVVLNNRVSNAVYHRLIRKGVYWKRKLFKIWNYKY